MNAHNHRLGLLLSIAAASMEADLLTRQLRAVTDAIDDGSTNGIGDAAMKRDLEEIKKHADRVSHLCGAEIGKLVDRLGRHAVVS